MLTVGILAANNEDEIEDCLRSVAWADELLVILDDRSQDRTRALAEALGARVEEHRFVNFADQRTYGLAVARGDWLFYVDSDERGTPALGEEIRRVIADGKAVGWWVPRRNWIWGREIRHGGWHPDFQLRLLRRGCASYDPARPVHEVVTLQGPEGHLQEPLIHYNYRTLAQFVAKQRPYARLEAELRWRQGIRPKPWTFVAQPLREFWRHYIRLQGFRDGLHGLLLCLLVAYYYGFVVTVLLARLRRRQR